MNKPLDSVNFKAKETLNSRSIRSNQIGINLEKKILKIRNFFPHFRFKSIRFGSLRLVRIQFLTFIISLVKILVYKFLSSLG